MSCQFTFNPLVSLSNTIWGPEPYQITTFHNISEKSAVEKTQSALHDTSAMQLVYRTIRVRLSVTATVKR